MAWADIEPGSEPQTLVIGCSRAEFSLCKQIPGCNIGKDGFWRAALTWPTYACFRAVWSRQPITEYPALAAWAEGKWDEVQERYRMRAALDASPDCVADIATIEQQGAPGGPQLSAVQRGAAEWLVRWRRVILGDDRGNGKTPPAIRGIQLLGREALPALVICPDSALLEWQRKLARWAPELRVVVIAGSAKKRSGAIEQLADGKADIGIIYWANVRYHSRLAIYPGQALVRCNSCGGEDGKRPALCEAHPKDLNAFRLGLVIADEAHRMADPTSKQTRAVWYLCHRTENVWALTGTLTVNDVGNLWPVQHALDPAGFPSRGRWNDLMARKDFAFAGRGQVILGLKPEMAGTFQVITDPMFRRVPKQIARAGQPGLAEPEFRWPPMTPKQDKAYWAVAREGLAELDEATEIVPGNSVVKFTRLCQLAGAYLQVTEGEDTEGFTTQDVSLALPSNKITDLLDFLGTEPGQWIVAVNSPAMAALAAKSLNAHKITSTAIVGGMNFTAKDAAAQAFQKGEHRVIFVNSAGSEAIDLQAAHGIFWLQPNPSFVYREQLTGRGDRWGQTREFRQVWCLSPGTVDIRLYQMGLDKAEQHQQVVRDPEMLRWMMSTQPGEIIEQGEDNGTGNWAVQH